MAAEAQGNGAVARHEAVGGAAAVLRSVGLDQEGAGRMTVTLHRAWAKDLDTAMLYELLKLRVEVFVVEQACAYPELDGRDLLAETRHFWLETQDGAVICTRRLM